VNYLFSGVFGFGVYLFRWPLLGLLVLGIIFSGLRELYHSPDKFAANNAISVSLEPVQIGQYEWVVAYRLDNNATAYRVTSLAVSCDGGETETIQDQMAPGHEYVGKLKVPYAEHLSNCSAHYSLERDAIDE
jgi:hypothetical protein